MTRFWHSTFVVLRRFKRAYELLDERGGSLLSGGIAFFAMLSLAPGLVVAMGMASVLLGPEAVTGRLTSEVTPLLGEGPAEFITELLANSGTAKAGSVAALIGTVVMAYAATRVVVELQNALHRVWSIETRERERMSAKALYFVYRRALAFVLVSSFGLLLAALTLAEAALQWVAHFLGFDGFPLLLRGGNLLLGYGALTALVSLIYRLLASGTIEWRAAIRSASITALLLGVGGMAVGLYLRVGFSYGVYGAAGSFAALMLAAYYAATIFLYGAALARVYGIGPET